MYSDQKEKRRWPYWCAALLVLVVVLVFLLLRSSGGDLNDESAAAIEEAVRAGALQCYVVEGIYPPDLAYLEEHYGLQINKHDYYVTYDAFASNIPPEIKVVHK